MEFMAELHPKVQELVAALNDAGLGWLAAEVLAVIDMGLLVEEPAANLERAKLQVRRRKDEKHGELRAAIPPAPRSLEGADQVTWATEYVIHRITDAVEMLLASQEHLNFLAVSKTEFPDRVSESVTPQIALRLGEDGPLIQGTDLGAARVYVTALAEALNRWRVQAEHQ